jgi:putative methyltransferase (TIGR01177 family)
LTRQSQWRPTSGRSSPRRSSVLFILSGEATGIPEGEARSLVEDLDPGARFERPEDGILLAETSADPSAIEPRVAFSRRVGRLIPDGEMDAGEISLLRRGTYRVRVFGDGDGREGEREIISSVAEKVDGRVSLEAPDREVSAFVGPGGRKTYIAITSPRSMRQGWAKRRPRSRAFFHPSAIFPKLSRALVNLSGVQPGETFLDPFCGTGSLLIEASIVGADPVGVDLARKMVRGARRNSIKYGQAWLGIVRADSRSPPLREASAIATDIPYGRASSAGGSESGEILKSLLAEALGVLAVGKKLVVMHPKSIDAARLAEGAGFRVDQEHDIYVHRMLTRTISVLRRAA